MFLSEHIPALFKKGTLKLVPAEDGGLKRVAEAMLLIEPFPAQLARELGEEIAGHLFTDDGAIRDELEAVDLRVRCGLQRVTVHSHEDLPTLVELDPVSVKDVTVKRIEDEKNNRAWLACTFVLVFSLESKAARNFILDEFGKALLWSFHRLQGDLLAEAKLHDTLARLGDPAGDGQTTCTFGVAGAEPVTIDANAHREKARELREKAKTH